MGNEPPAIVPATATCPFGRVRSLNLTVRIERMIHVPFTGRRGAFAPPRSER